MKKLSDKQAEEFIEKHGDAPRQPTYGDGMMYTLVVLSTLYNLYAVDKDFNVVDWICYGIAIVISLIELRAQVVYRKKMEQVKEDLFGLLDALKDKVPKL